MASQLKVDSITGVTTAGSISVTGEGNSTTTNLQQGLAKAWANGTATATVNDSFNVSAGTDHGTGDYSYSFINNLDSADMVANITCAQNANSIGVNNGRRATSFDVKMFTDSGSLADRDHGCVVHGDLA